MVGVTAGTAVTAGAGVDLSTVGPSLRVRLPEASWGSRQRPAPPTTAMATRLITATPRPTGGCTTGQRTTDRPIIAARTTGPSTTAAPTGGLSTTAEHITGQRTSTDVRTTGVRTGGDEDKRAGTIAAGTEAPPELELGRGTVLDGMAGAVSVEA